MAISEEDLKKYQSSSYSLKFDELEPPKPPVTGPSISDKIAVSGNSVTFNCDVTIDGNLQFNGSPEFTLTDALTDTTVPSKENSLMIKFSSFGPNVNLIFLFKDSNGFVRTGTLELT